MLLEVSRHHAAATCAKTPPILVALERRSLGMLLLRERVQEYATVRLLPHRHWDMATFF